MAGNVGGFGATGEPGLPVSVGVGGATEFSTSLLSLSLSPIPPYPREELGHLAALGYLVFLEHL